MSDICPKCGGPKEPPGPNTKRRSWCRPCSAADQRARYAANPEHYKEIGIRSRALTKDKITARNKAFYAANRDREKARAQKWRDENPERSKTTAKAWQEANAERFAEMRRAWLEANPDYYPLYRRKWYAENREESLAKSRAYKLANEEALAEKAAQYWHDHPELSRAHRAKRRAAEKRAMPAWADCDKMMAFYVEAVRLTRETGIAHHVDHIYPLQSKIMCGLHCEINLQVVPATVNQRKKNKPPEIDEEPRCCAWPSVVHFEPLYGMALKC